MNSVTRYDLDSFRRWGKYLAAALVFQGAIALLLRGGIQQQPFIQATPLEMELVAGPPLPATAANPPAAGGAPAQRQTVAPPQPVAAPPPLPLPTPLPQSVPQAKPEAVAAPVHAPVPAPPSSVAAAPVSGRASAAGSASGHQAQANQGGSGPAAGGAPSGGVGTVTQARPNYLHNPPPSYPPLARRRGLTGRVVLKVRVGSDGLAREVGVRSSSGHAVLDQAAVSTVASWRFSPARRGDTPLESWVDVPINFELKGQERG